MIVIVSREEKELIQRLRSLGGADSTGALSAEVVTLKQQIATLEIDKSKKQEEFGRRERELRHMIGLEKKRQEVEIDQAKKETALTVREENLKAEKARFEEHLKFNTQRFETMEKYLKEMFADVLQRLPNVNVEFSRTVKR